MRNYVGNKNIPGVIEYLTNRIPKSERYFSLFMGMAGLENSVYTADAIFTCSEMDTDLWKYSGKNKVTHRNYLDLLEENVLSGHDFVFADPPYTFCTRRSGRKYYKFEFTIENHRQFLHKMNSLESQIMITHPKCKLYDDALKGWNSETFTYMSREGLFHDNLYTNYDVSTLELLNYEVLGKDFIERQAIKRQRKNIVQKFKRMPKHHLDALIIQLKKEELI